MRAGLQRVVDDDALQPLDAGRDESVMDALGDDQARGGGAALAGREEGAVDGAFDRRLEVGVVEHDHRVLAAHFELELLHRARPQAAATLRPVPTEPVKVMALDVRVLSGCVWPTTEP